MKHKIKVLKANSSIKDLEISAQFYDRLSGLAMEIANLSVEDPETYKHHLETLIILMTTIDELAEKQDVIEDYELDVEDSTVENTDNN